MERRENYRVSKNMSVLEITVAKEVGVNQKVL